MSKNARITKLGSFDNLLSWEVVPWGIDTMWGNSYTVRMVHVVDGQALKLQRNVSDLKSHKELKTEISRILETYQDILNAINTLGE